jgi:release factor glutamine methyltransferase
MLTLLEIIKRTTDFLETKGVESPRLNAELLIGHVLGLGRMQLYLQFERLLKETELEKIRPLVKRRSQREPLQYVLGETEFFHLKFKTDRRALIPRPETEQLCELVTQRLPAPPAAILDLGTGGGAIALALAAHYREATVTAVDLSQEALSLADENAAALDLSGRIRWLRSDWFAGLAPEARFDLIIANPPYLTEAEAAAAMPGCAIMNRGGRWRLVRREPRRSRTSSRTRRLFWRRGRCSRWKPESTSTRPCAS